MLGTQKGAVCIQCHEAGSEPYQLASRIKAGLDEFLSKLADAENSLDKADRRGVDVSDPRFKLMEAKTTLILVRNLTHALDLSEIEKKIAEGEGVISEVKAKAEAALKEARFRKRGLIIATFFILLLAIAIFLKIKQIEKKRPAKKTSF
jgi:hypothetical protein